MYLKRPQVNAGLNSVDYLTSFMVLIVILRAGSNGPCLQRGVALEVSRCIHVCDTF